MLLLLPYMAARGPTTAGWPPRLRSSHPLLRIGRPLLRAVRPTSGWPPHLRARRPTRATEVGDRTRGWDMWGYRADGASHIWLAKVPVYLVRIASGVFEEAVGKLFLLIFSFLASQVKTASSFLELLLHCWYMLK
jgi:hypothetical protein